MKAEAKGWLYFNKLLDDFYHDRLGAVARKGGVTLPKKKKAKH